MEASDHPVRLLFLCSQNRLRSPTALSLFRGSHQYRARSAGTSIGANVAVTASHVSWADIIFCMEPIHEAHVRSKFPKALGDKRLICLNIPDKYTFMDPALIAILRQELAEHIELP